MSALVHPRMRLLRWLALVVVLVVAVAAAVVLGLHYRSRYPGTAARLPHASGSRQVNPAIERRAQQFLAALRAGDEGQLRAMAFDGFARDNVSSFGCTDRTLAYFADDQLATFSAALVPIGNGRFILDNDNHAPTRRRASVAHEVAHVLLEHAFTAAILGPDGCRAVPGEIEEEATWFSGELLITFKAAMALARRGASDAEVAARYGVSPRFAAMRMNTSGARVIATRQRQASRR